MRYIIWIAAVIAGWHASLAQAAPPSVEHLSQIIWAQPGRPKTTRTRTIANKDEGRGTTEAGAVKAFWDRSEIVLAGLKDRGVSAPAAEFKDGRIVALVDKAAVGLFYDENGPTRYLALHLSLGSTFENTPVTVHHSNIKTFFNGQEEPLVKLEGIVANHGFQTAGEMVSLQNCQPFPLFITPPKGITGQWMIFPGLSANQDIPKVTITLSVSPAPDIKQEIEVPVTEVQRALMQLQVERLGPKDGLALLTIGGVMNSYNLFGLASELDDLVEQKVSRVVVQWKPTAPAPDGQLLNWLQQSAMSPGLGRATNEQLPPLNSAVQELHLVQLKNGGFSSGLYRGQPGAPRVHATAADAVMTALQSSMLTLSRDDLRTQIQKGHPLARAAALRHGAAQLDLDQLPLVRQLAEDDDPAIRMAAITALGDFAGVPDVLAQLEQFARGDKDDEASAAIQALATSRYAAGRKAVQQWLADPETKLQKRVLTVLANTPRAEWGDALFAHAHGPDGKLRVDVLRALVPLDHPRLVVLLDEALQSSDKSLREFVFPILAQRTDERSEQLASRYALQTIEQSLPDAALIEFLGRTKDQRALPALLRHLDHSTDRLPIINLLGQMGDRRAGDQLVQKYPSFKSQEQSAALHALRALRHEQFPDLAAKALISTDGALLSSATQTLLQDGSRSAVEALSRGLDKQTQPYAIAMICNALAGIGTSEARSVLLQQRSSKEPVRRKAGSDGLQNLLMRSPGYSYVQQARTHRINRQDDEAFETYTLAIQIDPDLADAYAGRGEMQLKREKWTDAAADLAKAAELDPYNGLACSGWAIALVMQGRYEDGVRTVEEARERLTGDVNYAYNAACVYGRLVEATLKQPESTERETRLKQYRQQALTDLAESVKLGFRDFAWMREDPDLKPLHDQSGFQDIVRGGDTKKLE